MGLVVEAPHKFEAIRSTLKVPRLPKETGAGCWRFEVWVAKGGLPENVQL